MCVCVYFKRIIFSISLSTNKVVFCVLSKFQLHCCFLCCCFMLPNAYGLMQTDCSNVGTFARFGNRVAIVIFRLTVARDVPFVFDLCLSIGRVLRKRLLSLFVAGSVSVFLDSFQELVKISVFETALLVGGDLRGTKALQIQCFGGNVPHQHQNVHFLFNAELLLGFWKTNKEREWCKQRCWQHSFTKIQ